MKRKVIAVFEKKIDYKNYTKEVVNAQVSFYNVKGSLKKAFCGLSIVPLTVASLPTLIPTSKYESFAFTMAIVHAQMLFVELCMVVGTGIKNIWLPGLHLSLLASRALLHVALENYKDLDWEGVEYKKIADDKYINSKSKLELFLLLKKIASPYNYGYKSFFKNNLHKGHMTALSELHNISDFLSYFNKISDEDVLNIKKGIADYLTNYYNPAPVSPDIYEQDDRFSKNDEQDNRPQGTINMNYFGQDDEGGWYR